MLCIETLYKTTLCFIYKMLLKNSIQLYKVIGIFTHAWQLREYGMSHLNHTDMLCRHHAEVFPSHPYQNNPKFQKWE